jgi:hypothetical protein
VAIVSLGVVQLVAVVLVTPAGVIEQLSAPSTTHDKVLAPPVLRTAAGLAVNDEMAGGNVLFVTTALLAGVVLLAASLATTLTVCVAFRTVVLFNFAAAEGYRITTAVGG